jgi:hypothetical protein
MSLIDELNQRKEYLNSLKEKDQEEYLAEILKSVNKNAEKIVNILEGDTQTPIKQKESTTLQDKYFAAIVADSKNIKEEHQAPEAFSRLKSFFQIRGIKSDKYLDQILYQLKLLNKNLPSMGGFDLDFDRGGPGGSYGPGSRRNRRRRPRPGRHGAGRRFGGGVGGAIIGSVIGGVAASSLFSDDEDTENNSTASDAAHAVGAVGGGIAGGMGGQALGAAIGTIIAPGIGTAVGGFLGNIIGGVGGATLGETIADSFDDVLEGNFSSKLSQVTEQAAAIANEASIDNLTKKYETVIAPKLASTFEPVGEKIDEFATTIGTFENSVADFISEMKNNGDVVIQTVSKSSEAIYDGVLAASKTAYEGTKKAIGSISFENGISGLLDTTKQAVSSTKESFSKAGTILGDSGSKALNTVKEGKSRITGGESGSGRKAVEILMSKGWTKNQAAGIAANLQAESNFRTTAVGDGGKAIGLGQWHPDRQKKFEKLYGKKLQEASFEEQVNFVDWELRNTEKRAGKAIGATKTAAEAAAVTEQKYERSALGLKGGVQPQRIGKANEYAELDLNVQEAPKGVKAKREVLAGIKPDKEVKPKVESAKHAPVAMVSQKLPFEVKQVDVKGNKQSADNQQRPQTVIAGVRPTASIELDDVPVTIDDFGLVMLSIGHL